MPLFNQKCKYRTSLWGVKIAFFDKTLVSALARGALAMCAMWVGNCLIKICGGEKEKTSGRIDCLLSCLVNTSFFFFPFTMVYFLFYHDRLSFCNWHVVLSGSIFFNFKFPDFSMIIQFVEDIFPSRFFKIYSNRIICADS